MADTTFTDGVTLIVADWLNDVNGHVYTTGSTATTFTFDGSGGTSGSVTLKLKKIGTFAMLYVPTVVATTGTGSAVLVSNTAIDAAFRPATAQYLSCNVIINNGASISSPGQIRVNTDGIIYIYRDNAQTAFSNSASGGTDKATTVAYYTG